MGIVNFRECLELSLDYSKKSSTFAADFHEEITECGVEQR